MSRPKVLLVGQVDFLQLCSSVVGKYEMRPPARCTAHVRTKHDVERCLVAKVVRVRHRWSQLQVCSTTTRILVVLHLVLDDKVTTFIAEGGEAGGRCKESHVLGRHQTLICSRVPHPRAAGRNAPTSTPLAFCARPAYNPALIPAAIKLFGEEDRGNAVTQDTAQSQSPLQHGGPLHCEATPTRAVTLAMAGLAWCRPLPR
mmetsp:Transcript_74609/g.129442  ORF Transcript_74609/g.129442 Transcript_74609/m.129442 type:complete len:201 (-) Transcript_74609:36-638(-)